MKSRVSIFSMVYLFACSSLAAEMVFEAGHPSLQVWRLPSHVPQPHDNPSTEAKVRLGNLLFFEPRLSRDGSVACATCHNPALSWTDARQTSKSIKGHDLPRNAPSLFNVGFNALYNWDGIRPSLEEQAKGVMLSAEEMDSDLPTVMAFLDNNDVYRHLFAQAFPSEPITFDAVLKAIGAFQRTLVVNDTPFDRWVAGDASAMSEAQVRGFALFTDAEKGNCSVCHSAPLFSEQGFHNLGLASFAHESPDLGRFNKVPLKIMRGAFRTPGLRNVGYTAPYFHDGSAVDLAAVMDHYIAGGVEQSNLSPNFKPINLNEQEKQDILAFLAALDAPKQPVIVPILP